MSRKKEIFALIFNIKCTQADDNGYIFMVCLGASILTISAKQEFRVIKRLINGLEVNYLLCSTRWTLRKLPRHIRHVRHIFFMCSKFVYHTRFNLIIAI